jgi:hypothetical protein
MTDGSIIHAVLSMQCPQDRFIIKAYYTETIYKWISSCIQKDLQIQYAILFSKWNWIIECYSMKQLFYTFYAEDTF